MEFETIMKWALYLVCLLAFIFVSRLLWIWWSRVRPEVPQSNREWVADCRGLGSATIDGSAITIKNVRDFKWRTSRDFDEKWIEVSANADSIKDVWFVIDHFHKIKGLAHTMISFEFEDGQVITFSFETRREIGERYHPWDGMWRAYELYLLVGTERDVLHLRTNVRNHKVHLFRAQTPPGKDKALLLALLGRLNQIAERPEWYHTIFSTCATSIVDQVNLITPGRIPKMWRTLLPGHSGKAAWKLKLIEDWGGFEGTMMASRIDDKASEWNEDEEYSLHIRRHLPPRSG